MSVVTDFFFILLQFLLPHHLLSRLVGKLADSENPGMSQWLIRRFIDQYKVDMREALDEDPATYASFNEFFVRPLKPDARTFAPEAEVLCSPADGAISQLGTIDSGRIFQAKGHEFSCIELLGGDAELASRFEQGRFATIYLSPKDYHRVHMPFAGELEQMIYVPGRLFSVNPTTTEQVPRLFARNERMVAVFSTDQGPIAVVMVGAMIVASIETVWAGLVTPPKRQIKTTRYDDPGLVKLDKGDELGRFKLGSTAIILTGDNFEWDESLQAGDGIQLGNALGQFNA